MQKQAMQHTRRTLTTLATVALAATMLLTITPSNASEITPSNAREASLDISINNEVANQAPTRSYTNGYNIQNNTDQILYLQSKPDNFSTAQKVIYPGYSTYVEVTNSYLQTSPRAILKRDGVPDDPNNPGFPDPEFIHNPASIVYETAPIGDNSPRQIHFMPGVQFGITKNILPRYRFDGDFSQCHTGNYTDNGCAVEERSTGRDTQTTFVVNRLP